MSKKTKTETKSQPYYAVCLNGLLGDVNIKRKFIIIYDPEVLKRIKPIPGYISPQEKVMAEILGLGEYKGVTIKEIKT